MDSRGPRSVHHSEAREFARNNLVELRGPERGRVDDAAARAEVAQPGGVFGGAAAAGVGGGGAENHIAQLAGLAIADAVVAGWIVAVGLAIAHHVHHLDLMMGAEQT